jgi:Right handed beta helix region
MQIDSVCLKPWHTALKKNDCIRSRWTLRFASSLWALSLFVVFPAEAADRGRRIEVGVQRAVKTLSEASQIAKDGDIVEVDAGDYLRDVATWTQNDLTLKAVNGRARLIAQGAAAESKGIWVVRGGNVTVKGFDFTGATVPDQNGAGIRLEKGNLRVEDCRFLDNENGILTGGHGGSTLEILNSEFGRNGFGDGRSHNLYVGAIAQLKVTGSYFHHAKSGHLLKSRAAKNLIFYNRLTDEVGGTASYELEFPNGGLAYVMGNVIQQSSTTENPTVVSFGAEGYRTETNRLYLINNTLIDMRPQGGQFLRVKPGAEIWAINNLLLGKGGLEVGGPGNYKNNYNVDLDEFVLAVREDFHLKPGSKLMGKAVTVNPVDGIDLRPTAEYEHPRSVRTIMGGALSPGAMQ